MMQYVWLFALERREADCSHPYSADVMKVCSSTSIFCVPSCHTPTPTTLFSALCQRMSAETKKVRGSHNVTVIRLAWFKILKHKIRLN